MPATAALSVRHVSSRAEAKGASPVAPVAWVAVATLALVAPFELLEPIVRLPWQSITNVELVLMAAGAVWLIAVARGGDLSWLPARLAASWLGVIAAMALAAAFAPESPMNALHMVGRLGMALGVCLMTASAATTTARAETLMTAASLSGVVAAALAMLEYLGVGAVTTGLRAFRNGLAVVGGQIRASGPLQYPTIASMYLEIVFAFLLGLLAASCARRRWRTAAAFLIAAVAVAEAIVLTFARAGLVTMAISLLVVGGLQRRRRGGRDASVLAIGVVAAIVAALVASSHSLESMRLRLTTETESTWYRARIKAPDHVSLRTAAFAVVPVTLTNTGRAIWDSEGDPPFRLSYHWLLPDADRVVSYNGLRTAFAEPVPPGATTTIEARVRAPMQPGAYRLMWDLVEEQRLWFSTEPNARYVFSRADVTGAVVGPAGALVLTDLPRSSIRPGRLVLWRAAARMLEAHPLLGIGLDNYRLSYGRWADLPNADPRVHSNDLYFEMLVGGGLVGGLAFAWLLWTAARAFARVAGADRLGDSAAPGVVAAGLAILVHGTVDTFLGFTPTYILIALTVGLAAAWPRAVERVPDAHRV